MTDITLADVAQRCRDVWQLWRDSIPTRTLPWSIEDERLYADMQLWTEILYKCIKREDNESIALIVMRERG